MRTDSLFTKKKEKQVLNLLFMLDGSGSMRGRKFRSALGGLNTKLQQYREREDLETYVTVALFNRGQHQVLIDNKLVNDTKDVDILCPGGNTPLYQSTYLMLNSGFKYITNPVQVTMFTDGEDNVQTERYRELLKEEYTSRENFTFIYEGENINIAKISEELNIPEGNILSYKTIEQLNTARGSAEWMYMDALSNGEIATKSFYAN